MTELNDDWHFSVPLGRRTYEGLDEEPMMEVDTDETYDNDFTGYEQNRDSSQTALKRMKQSPKMKI